MSALLDKIPFVPKLTKFLVCLDLYQGVRITSIVLIALWIIYAAALLASSGASGFAIWSLIWCLVTVGVYGLVIWGMQKNNRLYLLPALYMTLFNIILGIINAIINFATLAWFGALWILAMQAVAAYYYCALKSVHDDMGSAGETAPTQDIKAPV